MEWRDRPSNEIGQRLFDATRAYQNYTRRLRKGEPTPQMIADHMRIVRGLYEASKDALEAYGVL